MLRARDNPFSTDRVRRQRYRFAPEEWVSLQERLAGFSFSAAIVGPPGTGKTTLLEDLAQRLAAQGWHVHFGRLNEERPRLDSSFNAHWSRTLGPKDLVILDGAEQLSWVAWRRFRLAVRRAGGLVISTHVPGRRLPTIHRCITSPALLLDLVNALGQPLTEAEATRLHASFRGNIRDALMELYERAATPLRPA